MAYLALYREWRPHKFADVVGQDHVVRTLVNALIKNRLSHAYLFCGPRGTGKTSAAKILARAVNCQQPQQGDPCGACELCLVIEAGTCMDVIEIDAASHRGIDEVREIREQVRFAPSMGSKRVFIIDEVHMLTNEAFNALLKTLEEPPSHVLFVLATTEPHRLPLTILSRCQRFDFHRVTDAALLGRLSQIVEAAGISIDSQALKLIIKAAEGAVRDALSILDQAAAYCGGTIGVEEIHRLLGTVREDMLENTAHALMQGKAGEVLELVAQVADEGKDLRELIKQINSYLHKVLLDLIESEGQGIDGLAKIIQQLSSAEQQMRWSSQPRVVLEVALIKATRNRGAVTEDADIAQLSSRVGELEVLLSQLSSEPKSFVFRQISDEKPVPDKKLDLPEETKSGKTPNKQEVKPKTELRSNNNTSSLQNVESAPASQGDDEVVKQPASELMKKIDSRWNDILEVAQKVCPNIASYLTQGRGWPLTLDGSTLIIGFPRKEAYTSLAMGILNDETNLKEISGLIKSVCQVDLRVRLTVSDSSPSVRKKKPKKTVNPEDVEMFFGEGEEVFTGSFGGFDEE